MGYIYRKKIETVTNCLIKQYKIVSELYKKKQLKRKQEETPFPYHVFLSYFKKESSTFIMSNTFLANFLKVVYICGTILHTYTPRVGQAKFSI